MRDRVIAIKLILYEKSSTQCQEYKYLLLSNNLITVSQKYHFVFIETK